MLVKRGTTRNSTWYVYLLDLERIHQLVHGGLRRSLRRSLRHPLLQTTPSTKHTTDNPALTTDFSLLLMMCYFYLIIMSFLIFFVFFFFSTEKHTSYIRELFLNARAPRVRKRAQCLTTCISERRRNVI